jgi:hypothetical protein
MLFFEDFDTMTRMTEEQAVPAAGRGIVKSVTRVKEKIIDSHQASHLLMIVLVLIAAVPILAVAYFALHGTAPSDGSQSIH